MTINKDILHLRGSIAPQYFNYINDEFVFFEKVNSEEGRFFTINNGEIDIIQNIYEGYGIADKGELYSVSIGEDTQVRKLSSSNLNISIKGTFFDFKIDELGNVLCLGHNSNESVIKIFSRQGEEIRNINIPSMFFASSITIEEDDIWVSGFTNNNKFKIMRINYIGMIIEEFNIDTISDERLISKIIIEKEQIYLVINGKKDSIYILNRTGDKIKEVTPKDLGVREIVDVNIVDNRIYILSKKYLYNFTFEDLISASNKNIKLSYINESTKPPYYYFMLIDMLREYFMVGILVSTCIYTLLYKLDYVSLTYIKGIFFMWIMSAVLAVLIGIIKARNRSIRITYLLNLQQKNTSGGFIRSLFLCTIISSLISLLFIGDFRIMNVIIYGLILVFTLVIDYSFRGYLNHNKEEVVIGLLNDDSRLLDHLRQLASQSENSNKILINIRIENELEKKYIAKWNDSRGFIIGKEINYILLNKTFITVVDLTNRDIKYSKISILADLICYIGEKGKLTDINAMWVD